MEKRYQVFVSSTFRDLENERRAVMQALLELDCIPAGMEMFPASSDDQWTLIQRVINDCDYYLVIVGGRYGSLDEAGISFTEREFDYAFAAEKPIIGFPHKDPGSIPSRNVETDPALVLKLADFRKKVERRMCKFWRTPEELGGVVSRSVIQLFKTHPAEGWVKARYAKTTEDLEKVNQMHERIRALEQQVSVLRNMEQVAASNLAQGKDPVTLSFQGHEKVKVIDTTWNNLFVVVARHCLTLQGESSLRIHISQHFAANTGRFIDGDSFEHIKIQFYSLGFIRLEKSSIPDSIIAHTRATETGWILTDVGRRLLAELIGAKRLNEAEAQTEKP